MTVRSLAEDIGMHPNTICGYLLGKAEPSYFFIIMILKVTGMPFEVAFERREKK
jgi:transcriptional regulator with XRE-family HTH domain